MLKIKSELASLSALSPRNAWRKGRMPDPRFFETLASLTTAEAAALTGATLEGADAARRLSHAASLAACDDIGAVIYCEKAADLGLLEHKRFGLCFIARDAEPPPNCPVGRVAAPRAAFAITASRLHRPLEPARRMTAFAAGARVAETAFVADTAEIGENVRIGHHVYIGPGVRIGAGGVIEAGAVVAHALIGGEVKILPGARIGQDGFGFVPGPDGPVKVPQLGRVVIGVGVEIGANTTIDRGALDDTVIGDGCKIDNLVQIGHNVRLGRGCIIAAQTGISGSCVIGDGVMMGGQVGLADHLTVGAGAQLAAGSGLMRDVPPGEKWGGRPARPVKDWLRETAALSKLAKKKDT